MEIGPPIGSGVPTGGLEPGQAGSNVLQLIFTFAFMLAGIIAVAFVIYAGIQWITSAGDKEKIQKARARLTYAIIGLIVAVSSFLIIGTIATLSGANPLFFLGKPGQTPTTTFECEQWIDCPDIGRVCGDGRADPCNLGTETCRKVLCLDGSVVCEPAATNCPSGN